MPTRKSDTRKVPVPQYEREQYKQFQKSSSEEWYKDSFTRDLVTPFAKAEQIEALMKKGWKLNFTQDS